MFSVRVFFCLTSKALVLVESHSDLLHMNIALIATNRNLQIQAQELAISLSLNFCDDLFDLSQWKQARKSFLNTRWDALLICADTGLSLLALWDNFTPLSVDFSELSIQGRIQRASIKNELIAKAIGLKKQKNLNVLDANAGLGQDSLLLASLGANVQAFERSPIVFRLLSDGLARAETLEGLAPIVSRINLSFFDSQHFLAEEGGKDFDVIYLDPMFPEKIKNALVKKEMQILKVVAGQDEDADLLVSTALASGCPRVVVKRPKLAGFVLDKSPDLQFKGSSSRFDVYFQTNFKN